MQAKGNAVQPWCVVFPPSIDAQRFSGRMADELTRHRRREQVMIMNIHDAISTMVRRNGTDKGTLTLGEVMDALQKSPLRIAVTINGKKPTSINSTGVTEHLAIATDERQGGERSEVIEPYRGQYSYSNADAAEVLIGSRGVVDDSTNALALCIGATFQGCGRAATSRWATTR